MGGQSITDAYTTVVTRGSAAAVFFNGRLAYVIDRTSGVFWGDVRRHQMLPVSRSHECRAA